MAIDTSLANILLGRQRQGLQEQVQTQGHQLDLAQMQMAMERQQAALGSQALADQIRMQEAQRQDTLFGLGLKDRQYSNQRRSILDQREDEEYSANSGVRDAQRRDVVATEAERRAQAADADRDRDYQAGRKATEDTRRDQEYTDNTALREASRAAELADAEDTRDNLKRDRGRQRQGADIDLERKKGEQADYVKDQENRDKARDLDKKRLERGLDDEEIATRADPQTGAAAKAAIVRYRSAVDRIRQAIRVATAGRMTGMDRDLLQRLDALEREMEFTGQYAGSGDAKHGMDRTNTEVALKGIEQELRQIEDRAHGISGFADVLGGIDETASGVQSFERARRVASENSDRQYEQAQIADQRNAERQQARYDDLVQTLVGLGYSEEEAKRAAATQILNGA